MQVLINAASAQMGGSLTYLSNVITSVSKVAPEDHFFVVLPRSSRRKEIDVEGFGNVELINYPYESTSGLSRVYFDQIKIPQMILSKEIDVLYSATGFGTFLSFCPQVLLVRNSKYFSQIFQRVYRESGHNIWRNVIRRWISLISVRVAELTLFPTQAMQKMVEKYIDINSQNVKSIHYGFNHSSFVVKNDNSSGLKKIDKLKREGYTIILNVSTYAVHKNIEVLIEALSHLTEGGRQIKLVTSRENAGPYKKEYDSMVRLAEEVDVVENWVELGYVRHERLPNLYARADVYVFPSFTESFGHPLVEAMAAGLPVVASDTSVNVEVCDQAGRYFPPFDAAACAAQIEEVLASPEKRHRMRQASRDRAKDFSWKKHVRKLVSMFRAVNNEDRTAETY